MTTLAERVDAAKLVARADRDAYRERHRTNIYVPTPGVRQTWHVLADEITRLCPGQDWRLSVGIGEGTPGSKASLVLIDAAGRTSRFGHRPRVTAELAFVNGHGQMVRGDSRYIEVLMEARRVHTSITVQCCGGVATVLLDQLHAPYRPTTTTTELA